MVMMQPRKPLVQALYSLIHFLFFATAGRIILGIILLGAGLYYGTTSHAVTYQRFEGTREYRSLMIDGAYNFVPTQSANGVFYQLSMNDFPMLPAPTGKDPETEDFLYTVESFVYETTPITSQSIFTRQGAKAKGYHVVEVTFAGKTGKTTTLSTQGYKEHPNGYTVNNWPVGLSIVGAGVAFLLLASAGRLLDYLARRKEQAGQLLVPEKQASVLQQQQSENPWDDATPAIQKQYQQRLEEQHYWNSTRNRKPTLTE